MSVLATQIENDEDLVTTGAVGRELVKMLHEEDSDHKESSADEEEEFEKDQSSSEAEESEAEEEGKEEEDSESVDSEAEAVNEMAD